MEDSGLTWAHCKTGGFFPWAHVGLAGMLSLLAGVIDRLERL